MATTLAVCSLKGKLQALLKDKEINNPKLRRQISIAKDKLEHVQKLLTEAEAKQTSKQMINVDDLEIKILQHVYSVDDMIDIYLTKTTLQRRTFFASVRPLVQLMALQSKTLIRKMTELTQEIDVACKVGDTAEQSVKSRDGGGHRDTASSTEQPAGSAKPAADEQSKNSDTPSISNDQSEQIVSNGQPVHHPEQPAGAAQSRLTDEQHTSGAETSVADSGLQLSDEQSMPSVKPSISAEPTTQAASSTTSEQKQESQLLKATSDRMDDELDFIGRKKEVEKLDEAILTHHKLRFLIAVQGAAGSGKTTFVRNIYNRKNVAEHFDKFRAWVNVSEEFPESGTPENLEQKLKNLLIDILKQVTTIKEEERLSLDKLEEKVRDFFIRKRFLIVLDDIKTPVVWDNLKRAFPNSLNGSRVILITRDAKRAAATNGADFLLLELPNLDIEDSWNLFLKKVQKTEKDVNDGPSLKNQIQEKCNGLPLALVVLGGLLSTKDPSNWLKVVEHLSFGDDPSKAILALAYQDLPSALKPCLLYLGIFPKEYVIPVRRLFRLWAAEGMANSSLEGGVTAEDLVERYLEELIKRNMIEVAKWRLDGSPKTCRVPGILYDSVFPNATEVGFFHVIRSSNINKTNSMRRAATYVDISDFNCIDNVRSYVSFNTRKGDTPADEIDKFLNKIIGKRGFGLLTVLDLENVYKPVLSEAIGKLLHLSYLGLRWTFLDSLPNSVGDIPNLETLDVKHTNITTLPISIWNSKKLRHLYMSEIYMDVSIQKPSSSGSLANLLTLWGLIIGKKTPGNDWLNKLTSLTKLGLTCHDESLKLITPWISGLKNLRSLKLRSIDEFSRPSKLELESLKEHTHLTELYLLGKQSKVDQLPQNLKMLTLSVSQLDKDPMPVLGQLANLNILRLFARSYIGKEMLCHANGFPKLRVLKLWMLEQLEKWTVEERSMPGLRELEIRCCEKLKEPIGWKHLSHLRELTMTNMPDEFVAAIEKSKEEIKGRTVTITRNTWEFSPLPKFFTEEKILEVTKMDSKSNTSMKMAIK